LVAVSRKYIIFVTIEFKSKFGIDFSKSKGYYFVSHEQFGNLEDKERGGGRDMEKVDKEHLSKHVDIESKRFFFDVKENHKGKYVRITELSGGRSCIVIPYDGIELFKERLGDIISEAAKLLPLEE